MDVFYSIVLYWNICLKPKQKKSCKNIVLHNQKLFYINGFVMIFNFKKCMGNLKFTSKYTKEAKYQNSEYITYETHKDLKFHTTVWDP